MERPIAYEPHPITPERKAELIAKGFRIIDAKYAPKDIPANARIAAKPVPPAIEDCPEPEGFIDEAFDDIVEEVAEAPKPRRGRKKKAK